MDRKKISLLRGRVTILYHQHLEARLGKGRWERGIRDTFLSYLKGVILLFVCYSLDIDIPTNQYVRICIEKLSLQQSTCSLLSTYY